MIYPFSAYLAKDEAQCVRELLAGLPWDEQRAKTISAQAQKLVEDMRRTKRGGQLEAFLQEFSLNTNEGLAMMTLAEALLRIPDTRTANELIRDKVAAAQWLQNQGGAKDWIAKAAGFGMALTRKTLDSALGKLGEPIIREAMIRAMQMMGRQFVLGISIEDAAQNAKPWEAKGYRMSYDILGEGAREEKTAEQYFKTYCAAVDYIGAHLGADAKMRPGISVKLSALHPRYSLWQKDRCIPAMTEKLAFLAHKAANYNIPLTVDAEEAARLEPSLEIIEAVLRAKGLGGWEGFGLAVQAYSKRAAPLIEHLAGSVRAAGRRIQLRLVKGAYWDSEIKRAQMEGLPDYPLFTRKCHTDVSYLACAEKMLRAGDVFYPMFATHNAHTVAAICAMAQGKPFEFQRLFGMGDSLYDQVLAQGLGAVSIYAPVGPHRDLLPYLVRRLLENGANSSFVNKVLDKRLTPDQITADPVAAARKSAGKPHPHIPLPAHIFGAQRLNSAGLDLSDATSAMEALAIIASTTGPFPAASILDGKNFEAIDRTEPEKFITRAMHSARETFATWSATPAEARAQILERIAKLFEKDRDRLMAILVHEAGKTIPDALAEVREAVDFCRYYAALGRKDFAAQGLTMPGYTGENNTLTLQGRGVFIAISPWNFPLAIFTGQIVAALMAGNCVLAKPASQTRGIAHHAVALMHRAGVPAGALHLLCGDGAFGAKMIAQPDLAGVVFTGSTTTAKMIQRTLAEKDGPIVPLIAETGGQNAMIVDSSALPEQVVDDVISSAFGSAGQRCSALRVLFLQTDIAQSILDILSGAVAMLRLGPAHLLSSDIGPIIDDRAAQALRAHEEDLKSHAKLIARAPMPEGLPDAARYVAPAVYEIDALNRLKGEVFGPILHVVRYESGQLDEIITQINATGFGLTFGVHSRIEAKTTRLAAGVRAGNVYINRSMIGAVVGVQPFGGMGLSGTGPKAGGPYYLHAFATEKHISINTAAAGGNASLVTMEE